MSNQTTQKPGIYFAEPGIYFAEPGNIRESAENRSRAGERVAKGRRSSGEANHRQQAVPDGSEPGRDRGEARQQLFGLLAKISRRLRIFNHSPHPAAFPGRE
jgi:hypothetical protein